MSEILRLRPVDECERVSVRGGGGRTVELAYDTFGDPADPPMLLVMGLGAQLVMWHDDLCRMLASRGFWVIRYDNRDVGLSTKFDEAGTFDLVTLALKARFGRIIDAPYTIGDMADDGLALLDALGVGRVHVVGVSMGGMIAQEMAIRGERGRIASLCSWMSSTGDRNLVLFDPRIVPVMVRPPPTTRGERIDHGVIWYRTIGSPEPLFDEPTVRELVGRAYDRSQYVAGFSRQLAAILSSPPRGRALSSLKIPTAVIHGTRDPLIPCVGGKMTAQAIPGAWFELIDGMGHDMPPALWRRYTDVIHHNTMRADKLHARARARA